MKKQVLFFLLMLMPLMASADTVKIDGINYNLISKANIAEVQSMQRSYSGDIVIPSTVEYENVSYVVTSIGERAFYQCSGLSSIIIPNSVTNIGGFAFASCINLTSVNIPNSVKLIEQSVFRHCSSLTKVDIPNSVISIGSEAFAYSGLTYVNIPNSVTMIDDHSFQSCKDLTSVIIGNGVKTIDACAFRECSNLVTLKIGSSVEIIGTDAFDKCSKLKDVYCYAENPPSAGYFSNYNLKTLYVPVSSIQQYCNTTPWSYFGTIKALPEGVIFKDDAVETLCLANWDTEGDWELNKDEAAAVTDLGSVFANNTDITSFDELQYFTGLTSIGEQAFYYCSNLNSIIIPENVTTIGNRAFYVCSGLKSLRIPANVSTIEDRAFAYCSGLETITVDDNNQNYDSRNNCNALIQTNSNTLLVGCKNTVIPSSVKVIAEGAFRGCTELANIVIPEGVTTIGANAFRGCTGLTSVTLPSTITSIGNYAFSAVDDVYNLTSVTVGMITPVAITSEVFPNRTNSTLYVPKGSMAAYKAANYWKEFKNIVELEDGVPVKCEKPVITLLANGKIKVESATEGATCVTNITASNADPLTDGEISLSTPLTVYTVTAYATKEGYDDSEIATATFRYEKSEGDINGDGYLNISDVVQLVNMILSK